ncbi:MAG: oxidoreductase [Angustibacter sp.]
MTGTAIVTGASSGIGQVVAERLVENGFTVYAAARRLERMAGLAERGVRTVSADVTDEASLKALVDQVIAETGQIDVLVNNAGYGSYGALEDIPIEQARRQVEVNLMGLARLIQLVLPHMRAKRSGRIVNVSSIGGRIPEPLGSWYHATKFAVEGLSDSLRIELAPFGIHVVVIQPAAIRTEWAGIARDSLLTVSGGTAYQEQARALAAAHAHTYDSSRTSSDPAVVADGVLQAVTARRPRTRYAVGAGARPILLARRLLPDRAFDALLRRVLKLP